MLLRGLLAAGAAIGFAFLAHPEAAQARGMGAPPTIVPGFYFSPFYKPGYRNSDQDLISCSEGRRIVRRAGYGSVSSLRCSGDVYRYRGTRRGYAWRISVNASSGAIVGIRRMGVIH
jgi:hypothetical protein